MFALDQPDVQHTDRHGPRLLNSTSPWGAWYILAVRLAYQTVLPVRQL